MSFLGRRYELTERAILLTLRWLFALILFLLLIYAPEGNSPSLWVSVGVLGTYIASNAFLTWLTKRYALERLVIPVFVADIALLCAALYTTIQPETDLYVMCFLIIYLSTLSRKAKDSLPLALAACLIYGLLLYHRAGMIPFMEASSLLRFSFLIVLALFTSYLADQTEQRKTKIQEMQKVQSLLAEQLQRTMVELRDKQAALIQAEKLTAMGHMAGALAHEIRNPLSVIIGYLEDLLDKPAEPEVLKMALNGALRSAVRCKDLMENLLNFSRRPRDSERFLLKDALQEAITLVKMSAKMSQVQCTFDVRANPLVEARRGEVQQIFINLMGNAVDAMPKGGNLTLRLEEEDLAGKEWVKATVEDTGSGIPESVREHLFEPFFTTKAPGKGTGLGLSIVQDIVQQAGGYIEVESELHKGTRFVVRLPRHSEIPSAEAPQAPVKAA